MLVKRAPNTLDGDKWCIPGGKPNPMEESVPAIEREIREELGVDFSLVYYYRKVHTPEIIKGKRWTSLYFVGELNELPKHIDEAENSEVAFFAKSELQEINIAFDHREILEQFFVDFVRR